MNWQIKYVFLLNVLMLGVLVLPRQASAETSCEIGFKSCIEAIDITCDQGPNTAEGAELCVKLAAKQQNECNKLKAECDAMPEASSSAYPPVPASKSGNFKNIGAKLENVSKGFYGDVTPKSFEETIGGYIKTGLALVGVIFLLLMVYGGYTWMIARGDETEAKKAKDTITMAAIGMAVVLIAYVITYFILSYAMGSAGLGT